jgi:hypothetical protein
VLFTPERHERLSHHRFDEAAAGLAIERIVLRAEQELDRTSGLWPRDDADATRPGEAPAASLYWGAAGVAWALAELGANVDRQGVEALVFRLADDPDDPDYGEDGVSFGLAGVLAVAEHLWPDPARRDRLADLAASALAAPALEPMMGHPGHMAIAAQLHARTGETRWADYWRTGAESLLAEWRHDESAGLWLWTQRLGEHEARYLGAAHGLVGNVHVLRRGGALLPSDVDRRAIETLSRLAVVQNGYANWPPQAGDPLVVNDRIRVQWCHGASGVITGMWDAEPADAEWSDLLLAAGRLVWDAGPIGDEPGLCHGTAGNAYALLGLWQRTNDELWLERARAFALHAAAQVEERAARLQRGRHSLFTGDEGVALCVAACLEGDSTNLPLADRLIAPPSSVLRFEASA